MPAVRKKSPRKSVRTALAVNRRVLRIDPSRTQTLRKLLVRKLRQKFARLKLKVVDLLLREDALGLRERKSPFTANERWRFRTDPEKIAAFQEWLKEQIGSDLLGDDTEALWAEYVQRGFAKGAGRAYDDYVKRHPEVRGQQPDFYRGTKEGFLRSSFGRPESVEKVKLLAGRAMDDLEGVTSEMSTRMVRHLTDGLTKGQHPKEIARALADDIDGIGIRRATTIAQTELIRTHSEAQLDALEALGVEEVGVMVEWATAGDEAVCSACEPLEGVVLRIEEARGMIPRHPGCRCSFLPANTPGEDRSEQQRGQKTVEKAIRRSQSEGDDEWGPGAPISKQRPKSVLNALDRFSALLSEGQ